MSHLLHSTKIVTFKIMMTQNQSWHPGDSSSIFIYHCHTLVMQERETKDLKISHLINEGGVKNLSLIYSWFSGLLTFPDPPVILTGH